MEVFIRKPVLAIVLSFAILLLGVLSLDKLSILQFPEIESSSLVINTGYTGASAEVVQGFITEPIERVAMTIPGVDFVDSKTTAGSSTVTAWLNLNEDSSVALARLTSKLSQISYELPQDALDPSVEVVRADRAGASFYLDARSDTLSRSQLTDYLSRRVSPQLSSIGGVQRVELQGGRNPAMRVWIDPIKMASLGLSGDDVFKSLQASNVIATLGKAENNLQVINLLSNAILKNADDFRSIIILENDDSFVRLGDIARVEVGEDRGTETSRLDQNETIYIAVYPMPGGNEIAIGDQLYKKLDELTHKLPDGMTVEIAYDGTLYMRNALREIFTTLGETIILVGIVVLLLMGSFRAALVPLVTIPISILGSLGVMVMMGFSLNLLTILAIVLSVGLVVDDAIVVVENVSRHMREGAGRVEAAMKSLKELLAPVIAMTLTLAVVYAPIGFLSGLTGALFKEFAFTLAVAVLISGIVAITLSPIMSAYVSAENGKESRMTQWVNRIFDRISGRYEALLSRTLEVKPQMIAVAIVISLLIIPFYLLSQKELAPVEDQSQIFIIADPQPGASLEYTNSYMHDVVEVASKTEGYDSMWQVVNASNVFSGINLVDFEDRNASAHEILPNVFGALTQVTGLKVFPALPMPLPTAGQFDVELVVQSQDSYANMAKYAQQIIGTVSATGLFLFTDTDLKMDLRQTRLIFDQPMIADSGLTVAMVVAQLSSVISEQEVNRYDGGGKAYRVIPKLEASSSLNAEALLDLQIVLPTGETLPLRSFATLKPFIGPRLMGKFDQLRSFRILGGLAPGVTNEMALSELERIAAEIVPKDYKLNYAGGSRQLRKDGNTMVSVLGVALVIVYLVLAVQFNSFKSPLVVLLGSVPLALSGALLFSFLGFTTINVYAQIGMITLVGLIAKNGILITEFANELQHEGLEKSQAVLQAAKVRFRPILMTTAATVLGHFPLVLVVGAGAEARNSIGIVLVAGMLLGTLFTLFILPTIYMVLGDNIFSRSVDDYTQSDTSSTASIR